VFGEHRSEHTWDYVPNFLVRNLPLRSEAVRE
jgi:hypothetical protein